MTWGLAGNKRTLGTISVGGRGVTADFNSTRCLDHRRSYRQKFTHVTMGFGCHKLPSRLGLGGRVFGRSASDENEAFS